MALMEMGDSTLGFACVEEGSNLYLWSRKVKSETAAEWMQCRVIKLDGVIPVANPEDEAFVVGSAEGVDVIFVTTTAGLFSFELKSGRVRKVAEPNVYFSVLPYMSFYIPGCGTLDLYLLLHPCPPPPAPLLTPAPAPPPAPLLRRPCSRVAISKSLGAATAPALENGEAAETTSTKAAAGEHQDDELKGKASSSAVSTRTSEERVKKIEDRRWRSLPLPFGRPSDAYAYLLQAKPQPPPADQHSSKPFCFLKPVEEYLTSDRAMAGASRRSRVGVGTNSGNARARSKPGTSRHGRIITNGSTIVAGSRQRGFESSFSLHCCVLAFSFPFAAAPLG
ncbi:hypothetical protein EJB05_14341, partial [Eragrostis curvula]